ncbi:PDZ domain-containing protein 11 [Plakobranchus ocellatus]|uniref:PDZ domain-containing protein 11 n=1 Tax=Plakobranchus ocellatus TaxID=259542 RepID=A0AAV4DTL8_9GAST|nr:PDZ domain-containing protein 11 [Plakobranchus ocellatus]
MAILVLISLVHPPSDAVANQVTTTGLRHRCIVNYEYWSLPPYEPPPPWIPPAERIRNRMYNNDLRFFLPRTVVLKRLKASDALGFNIRGGREHNFGFYVSKVIPDTGAANAGVQEGDQILRVNNIDFGSLDHSEAVRVLKYNTTIEMVVRYFPYGYQRTYDGLDAQTLPQMQYR